MKSKSLKVLSIIACIVFVFTTSCEEIDTELMNYADAEYIDIPGDLNDIMVLANTQNWEKYSIAIDRVLSGAIQKGNTITFKAQSGSEINVSEQIFSKIVNHYTALIESGEYLVVKENGKNVVVPKNQIGKGIVRLKSAQEGDGSSCGISLANGCNEPQAVINGFMCYDRNTTSCMSDLWNMDSRNWGTASQNNIQTSFTINGYSGRVQLNNGCFNSNNSYNGSNNCSGNYICSAYKQWDDQAQVGYFIVQSCDGRPLAVIQVQGYNAYQYMANYIGW